jgi:cytochrome b561
MIERIRYDAGSRAIHWLTFLAVTAAFGIAWRMDSLPFSPLRIKMFNWHKWAGVTVLVLTLARIAWRLYKPAPPPVAMPAWQRISAKALHGLLYLALLAQPLTGWAHSNASGYPVVWFGVLPLPNLVAKDKALSNTFESAHAAIGTAILVLLGLHVLAALKHHFVDRDDTLRRMLPH